MERNLAFRLGEDKEETNVGCPGLVPEFQKAGSSLKHLGPMERAEDSRAWVKGRTKALAQRGSHLATVVSI